MKKGLITILSVTVFTLVSCNKDFLEKNPSEYISSEQIKEAVKNNPAIIEGYVKGMYATMYLPFAAGVKDVDSQDDYGQKGYDLYMDLLSGDMVLGGENYGWYRTIARLTAPRDFTQRETAFGWRYYYKIIGQANTIIDILGGVDADLDESLKPVMGQALAMRGYSYFYLANLYSREGYGTGSEKILPIYTSSETTKNVPLSTSKEVYDLIVSDLEEAILLTNVETATKNEINSYVAKGMLAYVLAARGTQADLGRVVTLTEDIIENSGHDLTNKSQVVANLTEILDANGDQIPDDYGLPKTKLNNPQSGFNDLNTRSWMWGMDLTLADKLDLVSWWGHVDYFTYSYATAGDPKVIDDGLYAQIRTGDVRKDQFSEDLDLAPTGKFFAPARIYDGQRYITTDYIYMRVDEMYLLNAEANARLNQDGAARTTLKKLLAERFNDASGYAYVDALSGQALKDEIYLQTRIELWGEGKAYLALKRNKGTVHRGDNHLSLAGEVIPYNDIRITFAIPQSEVVNNPNLYK